MLLQNGGQSCGVKVGVLGDLVDDVGEVGEQIALVLVTQNGGHTSIVELKGFVVGLDKVDGGVFGNQRGEGFFDDLRHWAL